MNYPLKVLQDVTEKDKTLRSVSPDRYAAGGKLLNVARITTTDTGVGVYMS